MKQKQSVGGRNSKPSVRKVGSMIGVGAITVFAIGAVGVYGFITTSSSIDDRPETNAGDNYIASTTTDLVEEQSYSETLNWRKAGVDEYDLAKVTEVSETTTTTTTAETTSKTTTATTTAAPKQTAYTSKAMYCTDAVNMRKSASTDSDVVTVLEQSTKVTATAETNDGWVKVKYDGKTGYVLGEYLTATAPVKTTTTAKTTTAATKTTAKKTTTVATTTKPATSTSSSTIKYTDEEFEMFCYVLQGEVGNCSEASKIAVANVIINRVKSSLFPDTIEGVLTAKNQFTAISYYYSKTNKPSENTKACALRALQGEDNSKGATFYYSPSYCSGSTAAWFETLDFCMELEGQRFFKN